MRPRSLLVLSLVVVTLLAFIWLFERDLPGTDEREAQRRLVLGGLEAEEIVGVTIRRPGEPVVRLERVVEEEGGGEPEGSRQTPLAFRDELAVPGSGERWRLAEPWTTRADAGRAEGLVASLAAAERSRTLEAPETAAERAALGLAEPRAEVVLETRDGEERRIAVGSEVPASRDVILGLGEDGGGEVVVAAAPFVSDLLRAPGEWRDPNLFAGVARDVERVRLEPARGPATVLVRDGERFRLESPVSDRAAPQEVEQLVGSIASLYAERYHDAPPAPPAELGLEPPRAVVRVEAAGRGEPFVIELGEAAEGAVEGDRRYARVDGQLVEIAAGELAEALERSGAEWRDRGVSGFEVYEIEAARVTGERGTVELERAGTDWKRDGVVIPYTSVSDLLYAATGAHAERLLEPARARAEGIETAEPWLTVVLLAKERPEETITFYREQPQGMPVRVAGRDVVLLLPPGKAEEIRDALAAVRGAAPMGSGAGEAEQG